MSYEIVCSKGNNLEFMVSNAPLLEPSLARFRILKAWRVFAFEAPVSRLVGQPCQVTQLSGDKNVSHHVNNIREQKGPSVQK